ncbi:hypothetical protein PENSPDRAFT_647423 [Peniophora sp. CONT]|nr:hypothetical protein PENSPDRAFT_647423 [Peniophora sp. CONT]
MAYAFCVLTVSDTASQHASADRSGPAIAEMLVHSGRFVLRDQRIVPDDEHAIRDVLASWTSFGFGADLVITTGGTGFGVRDRTPEAVTPLLQKHAPGLVHLLLASSLEKTPFGALSRPVAGTVNDTLVVTLPGSLKAVKEGVEVLLASGLVDHALDLIKGGSGETLHRSLAKGKQPEVAASLVFDATREERLEAERVVAEGFDVKSPPHTGVERAESEHTLETVSLGDSSETQDSSEPGTPHTAGTSVGAELQSMKEPGTPHAGNSSLAPASENAAPHHHHHHDASTHHIPEPRSILSHDPSLPPTARHRVSPYNLVSYEQATETIMNKLFPLSVEKKRVNPSLAGHVLAEDVYAPHNIPSTQTTSVDGYAILASTDGPGIYKVVTSATHKTLDPLPEGTIYRINTGGPLPVDTDAVIMVEDTHLISAAKDEDGNDAEELEIETLVSVPAGENVRQPGSDVKEGDLVLSKDSLLRSTGGEIGTLAFVGRTEVSVVRKPVVAILSTGNELVDLQDPVNIAQDEWGGIYDTNRPSLQAALEGLGYEVSDLGIVDDSIESHVSAIKRGLTKADVLLTTGGTSMGASDLLKPVIERHFGGSIHFGRVMVKPGKPTTFATLPVPDAPGVHKTLFALPGNPASALVMFHVFVVPALRRLGGYAPEQCHFPLVNVKIDVPMRLDLRVEFHRVVIRVENGGPRAYSTGGQRSSRVASLNGANGLVVLPKKTFGGFDVLEKDSEVQAMLIGELQMVQTRF